MTDQPADYAPEPGDDHRPTLRARLLVRNMPYRARLALARHLLRVQWRLLVSNDVYFSARSRLVADPAAEELAA